MPSEVELKKIKLIGEKIDSKGEKIVDQDDYLFIFSLLNPPILDGAPGLVRYRDPTEITVIAAHESDAKVKNITRWLSKKGISVPDEFEEISRSGKYSYPRVIED